MSSRSPVPPSEPSKEELEKLRKHTELQWAHKNVVKACMRCKKPFTYSWWKKRCKNCGDVLCTECSKHNLSLPEKGFTKPVRVCTTCYEKIVGFPSAKRGQLLSNSHGMPRIMYASTSRHGLREDNEDRICVDIKWNRDDPEDMNPRFMAFFGVFDGHSGSDTSQHLKEKLPADILNRLRQGHLTPNEISHLRTMSRSSRRGSRKFEPSFTASENQPNSNNNNNGGSGNEEKNNLSSVPTQHAPTEAVALASLFDDPEEPSLSHVDSQNGEHKQDMNEFSSACASSSSASPVYTAAATSSCIFLEPLSQNLSNGTTGGASKDPSSMSARLSDSIKTAQEKEYSKSNNNSIITDENLDDLSKIVQYSCMRTDHLYGQNQLKKPNSERSHSGSCAVFVVFTNAKLSSNHSNNSRLRDAFKWFRRASDSTNDRSVNSRNERERSVSRSIRDALSPARISPKNTNNIPAWNSSSSPSDQLLSSPNPASVIPWIFRGSKPRPPRPDLQSDLSVVCASVGDSEIVMHERGHSAVSLFPKHNWTDPEEERRVKERGGDIREQHGVKRICVPGTLRPTLAVSRSFGDVAFKKGARITKSKKINFFRGNESAVLKDDLVTCVPALKDISSHVVAGELNLLVLASDGLWDMFGHEEAITFIEDELNEHFKKREAVKKKNLNKRRASEQVFSPSRQDNDGDINMTDQTLLSTSSPAVSSPPVAPVSLSSQPSGLATASTKTAPPPPLAASSLIDHTSPDTATSSVTPRSISSASSSLSSTSLSSASPQPAPLSLSSAPSTTTTPTSHRGGRAASTTQTASTIVIHRPARRRSESFSSINVPTRNNTSSPALNLVHSASPSPLSSVPPSAFSISCPSTPTSKSQNTQTNNNAFVNSQTSSYSFTSTYPTIPRVSSPLPPPLLPSSQVVPLSNNSSSVTSPLVPLSVQTSSTFSPTLPQQSPLTVTAPISPTSHIHVTFANTPQYFNPPLISHDSPSTIVTHRPSFAPGPDEAISPVNAHSPLSPYSMHSPSRLSTHSEHDDGGDLLPEITDRDLDAGHGSEFPPLVTIVSPDPSEIKTPGENYVQPRNAWTAPAPSKHSRRDLANGVSMDDSRVEYANGPDAEEVEDWTALQRICDKLADAAVKRMELQPNLEGDNVSVVIIYFPS